MNIEHNLVLVKGEDQTSKIRYCEYSNGKYDVTYMEGRIYSYNSSNIIWIRKPTTLDPGETVISYQNQTLSNISKILIFDDKYVRVIFQSGKQNVYQKRELIVEKNCINNKKIKDCLAYLKQLASAVGGTSQDGEFGYLASQFEKISHVRSSSVLANFLKGEKPDIATDLKLQIFPFGFNINQKRAAQNAKNNRISIIEGPPGTGKTQTILNIIADALLENKTIAVVSNNNSATANVLEKLEKYGLAFVAAYLGNKGNKDLFFAHQDTEYPKMEGWELDGNNERLLRRKLEDQSKELDEMLFKKNSVAILKQELSEFLIEKEYFDVYEQETNEYPISFKTFHPLKSSLVMKLWIDYRVMIERGTTFSLFEKIKYLFRFGIYDFRFYKNPEDRILSLFQKVFYENKISELNEEINSLDVQLTTYSFDEVMKVYAEDSMKLLKSNLAKRFSNDKRPNFGQDVLKKDTAKFLKEYPVILSTTHSIKRCAEDNFQFDYLIIDESTQVDIVTGALALSCAKRAVIVGDLKQLPNVVTSEVKEISDKIFNTYNLSEAYRYSSNSILSALMKLLPDVPKIMLREHYRCHPKIIGFCNKKYYNGDLIILTEEKYDDQPLKLVVTVQGNHARGNYNQRQIDSIFEEIIPSQRRFDSDNSIGIISPYRMQTEELKLAFEGSEIEADTVHKFQGREKNVIILSTVSNEINDFIDDPNLLNVAVSRAAKRLIVVASEDIVDSHSNIGDLSKYIRYNNFEVQGSKIYSVFDLLYKQYSKQLLDYMANLKMDNEVPSEIIMNELIEKILNRTEFSHLAKVLHQPLKMLIRDPILLNERECEFAMNINAHTDFLIFNKFDKSPVLVVEVDGYSYHKGNPQQLQRDKLKDSILKKYAIPILRLATNGSGEEEKIVNELSKQLSN